MPSLPVPQPPLRRPRMPLQPLGTAQPDGVLDSIAEVDPLALVEEFFAGEVLPLATVS